MLDYLKNIADGHLPPKLRQALLAMRKRLCLTIPVYRVERPNLSITLIGRHSCDPYWLHLMFGECQGASKISRVAVWNIDKAIAQWEKNSDLIIFRDREFKPSAKLAHRLFSIPFFISQSTADLPPTTCDLLAAFRNPSAVSDIHKIQRAGFAYHVADNLVQLRQFYEEMYKPFILSRHGGNARLQSWPEFKHYHKNMELLLITRNGQTVAGALNLQAGDCYTGYTNGVLGADPQLLKDGIVSAIYWFGIVEAHRRGCRTVNLGVSRPFLKNGVLAYKKKWGGEIIPNNEEADFQLLACGKPSAVQHFFEANPFICRQDDNLASLIFLGQHVVLTDKELSSQIRAYLFHGIRLLTWIIVLTPEWAARIKDIEPLLNATGQPYRIINYINKPLSQLPALIQGLAISDGMPVYPENPDYLADAPNLV